MSLEIDLKGKVAVVTGAASGNGRAAALALARAGARVVCADRSDAGLRQVSDELSRVGAEFTTTLADVTSGHSCTALAEAVGGWSGGAAHILVNSAGVYEYGSLEDVDLASWERAIAVNLLGVFNVSRALMPLLRAGRASSLLTIGSVASVRASQGNIAYATSKHALLGLTRSISLDYGRHGVRANLICPSIVDTPMAQQVHEARAGEVSYEEFLQRNARAHPIGRVGTTEDIADLILFLASDHASWITGQAIVIDGGISQTVSLFSPPPSGP